jgi:hypothetical protein
MKHNPRILQPILLVTLVLCAPGQTRAAEMSIRERINAAVGREMYVDDASIPEKVHGWADIKRWIAPRGGAEAMRMAYPANLKGSGISEVITVRLIITPEGRVLNPVVEDLNNKELALPAILHVANLRFQIPRVDGKPVYLNQKVKLVCSEDPEFGR